MAFERPAVNSTSVRCLSHCEKAIDSLQSALATAEQGLGDELVASEVRIALESIGKITGTIYTDDILDVVFGKFCIGK